MIILLIFIQDIKCSGNWMWPAKLSGEGAALLDACVAMCDFMKGVGVALDGGKDSLSMAARVGDQVVKAPGIQHSHLYISIKERQIDRGILFLNLQYVLSIILLYLFYDIKKLKYLLRRR